MTLTEQATAAMTQAINGGDIIRPAEWWQTIALCTIADTLQEKPHDR